MVSNRVLSLTATALLVGASHGSNVTVCQMEQVPNIFVYPCGEGQNFSKSASLTIESELGSAANSSDPRSATVSLCYTDTHLDIEFYTSDETSFFVNETLEHNDNIWDYTVMEAFIAHGQDDPANYFEFEVSPINQTYTAQIINPDLVRSSTYDIEHMYLSKESMNNLGITVSTERTMVIGGGHGEWTSKAKIPFRSIFNVKEPSGTWWRMNFLRTTKADSVSPQRFFAWSPPSGEPNFHVSPCFGRVVLV